METQVSVFEAARLEMHARAQPAIRLAATANASTTFLGGTPHVPRGFAWPEYNGKPLAFIAQVDASVITRTLAESRPDWFPDRGSLVFFYDSEQSTWGFDPKDRGSFRVAWFAEIDKLAAVVTPSAVPSHARYAQRALSLAAMKSYPSESRLSIDSTSLTDDEFRRLRELSADGRKEGSMHQILGFPTPRQRDAMELSCQLASNGIYVGNSEYRKDPRTAELAPGASDWRLLLQVDSDEDIGMMWGDGGMLYFWVRQQDARAHDFSNVWMVLQSG